MQYLFKNHMNRYLTNMIIIIYVVDSSPLNIFDAVTTPAWPIPHDTNRLLPSCGKVTTDLSLKKLV